MAGRERSLVKLLIGHESEPIDNPSGSENLFRWTCFIRPVNGLPNFEDRSFISKVKFKLHDSYAQPVRIVREPPFEVTETCYGSFDVFMEIYFAYPGAKSMKYNYDMLIQLEKKSQASTEVMFELKDAPPSFLEHARKYGIKRKRSGGSIEDSLRDSSSTLPQLKIQKVEDSERLAREGKHKKEDKLNDRSSKEKSSKEKQSKDREKKRDKEKYYDKEKSEKHRKNEEKEKKREEKQRMLAEDKSKTSPHQLKFTPPYRLSPIQKNSPDLNKLKKETPYSSPTVIAKNNRPKSYLKHLPSKEEKKTLHSESDISSPSTSYGSLTPKTPLSLPNSGIMSPSEMQRRISLLTDEEQIFRVATLLISVPGTDIHSTKLSFDLDLSTVDPRLLSKLNEALL